MHLHGVLLILVYYFSKIWCRLEPISDGLLATRISLAKCVGNASDHFFGEDEISLVSLSVVESKEATGSAIATDKLLFSELFNRSNLSIIIKKTSNPSTDESYIKKIDNYIIQVRHTSEIEDNLNMLTLYPTWNSHAKFVVISAAPMDDPSVAAASIIEQLWLKKIVNGVVLLVDPQNTTVFMVYSWNPFSESRCRSGLNEIKVIDRCSFGIFTAATDWFPSKIPHNLNGCSFRVRAVVWPPYVLSPENNSLFEDNQTHLKGGIEVMLLNTMAEIANFSVNYTVSNKIQNWGSVFANGTATGALLYLKNEKCDILIGSFAGTVERHMYLDYVTYNRPESLAWCVPHASDTEQWKKLLMVISADIWYLCSIIYVITSVCLWALCINGSKESSSYKNLPSCLQNSFSILVNMAVKVQPKTLKVRLLFLIWSFFTVHIAAIYKTSLISVLTKPKYEQQIKTILDIFNNNLDLWLLTNTRRYFRDESDWINQKILKEWKNCDDIRQCLNDTAFHKNSATCTPRLYMKYAVNHYVTKRGAPLLYCFKESVTTYPLEMFLVKGFPLKMYFERLVGRITAAGLIVHWERQIFDVHFRNIAYGTSYGGDDHVLTVSHLQLIFIILMIGNATAFIIFLLEIYVYNKKPSHLAE